MAIKSYDENQRGAVLVTCAQCGKSYFMVVPWPICASCREANRKGLADHA